MGYADILLDACATGRRLTRDELESRRAQGTRAAEAGLTLRGLIREQLAVAREIQPLLPARAFGPLLAAVEQAVDAFAEGYEQAQQQAVRQEEAARREFVDDLLYGGSDLGRLAERAERFGLRLAQAHAVAVAEGPEPYGDGYPVARGIEQTVLARFDNRKILLTTKDGRLICVAPGDQPDVLEFFAKQAYAATDGGRVGIGRSHHGAGGVVHSYEEALNALDLAERMGLEGPVLYAADLLVYPVLTRDRQAMADLVESVLGPLHQDNARQAAEQARLKAEEEIAVAQRTLYVRQAEIKAETDAAAAQANAAGPLAEADRQQQILSEQEKVAERQAALTDRQLDTQVRKPADARRYQAEQEAEALRVARVKQAEAERLAAIAAAEAEAERARLTGEGEKQRRSALAEAEAVEGAKRGEAERAWRAAIAEAVRLEGDAEAAAIAAKGSAEAEAMRQKAEAFERYGDAAMVQMMVEALPEVVAKAAEPLSAIDRMTVISTDGASKLSRTVTDNVAQGMELLGATTGVDLAQLLKGLTSGKPPVAVEPSASHEKIDITG
ncbi:flotillin domain-containing protein [Streptomyces sp. QHH-9511]|uniref:flotillin domain-containing protein n=1 Tax=Streptomyces sp. QHH-9511 TaxID=2684468 RepID=UPI001E4504D8|nr:flotillin domain-containing protein [Streptomyces sp. QHH-9511]